MTEQVDIDSFNLGPKPRLEERTDAERVNDPERGHVLIPPGPRDVVVKEGE
jgi:hypothetical protein